MGHAERVRALSADVDILRKGHHPMRADELQARAGMLIGYLMRAAEEGANIEALGRECDVPPVLVAQARDELRASSDPLGTPPPIEPFCHTCCSFAHWTNECEGACAGCGVRRGEACVCARGNDGMRLPPREAWFAHENRGSNVIDQNLSARWLAFLPDAALDWGSAWAPRAYGEIVKAAQKGER